MSTSIKLEVGKSYITHTMEILRVVSEIKLVHKTLFATDHDTLHYHDGGLYPNHDDCIWKEYHATPLEMELKVKVGHVYLRESGTLSVITTHLGSSGLFVDHTGRCYRPNGQEWTSRYLDLDLVKDLGILGPAYVEKLIPKIEGNPVMNNASESSNESPSIPTRKDTDISFYAVEKTFDFYRQIEDLKKTANSLGMSIEIRLRSGEDYIDVL